MMIQLPVAGKGVFVTTLTLYQIALLLLFFLIQGCSSDSKGDGDNGTAPLDDQGIENSIEEPEPGVELLPGFEIIPIDSILIDFPTDDDSSNTE